MLREMKTTVVNRRHEPFDVYIGRGSKWGNPFQIGPDGNRSEVISKYKDRLLNSPELLSQLEELRGKRLGCYCKPKPCHGDVLAYYADLCSTCHLAGGPCPAPKSCDLWTPPRNKETLFGD